MPRLAVALLLITALVGFQSISALAGELLAVEPAALKQGDTALITIRGKDIPTGTLVLEFFPQQVAVMSVLSATPTEIQAQVKVPALATPGPYNIVIYNQLGEEVFGQGLFNVTSTVLTPVFKTYDPKVIAQADTGFALILSGDAITPDAAPHLSAEWYQGEHAIGGLYTTFAYNGGNIMCAVTGRLPTGQLRGRIMMGGKAIYLVEIEIRGPSAIVGHSPTSINSAPGAQKLKLVGNDFSTPYLAQLKAELRIGNLAIEATQIVLRDRSTAELSFVGPLREGHHALAVSLNGVVIYDGALQVLPPLSEPEPLPELVPPDPALDVPEVIDQPEPADSSDSLTPTQLGPVIEQPVEQAGEPFVEQIDLPAEEVLVEPVGPRITGVSPSILQDGDQPFRLTVTGEQLDSELLDRLQVLIEAQGAMAQQQLGMATKDGFSFMFLPPSGGWNGAKQARVTISDSLGQISTFEQPLAIESGRQLPQNLELQVAPDTEPQEAQSATSNTLLQDSGQPVMIDPEGFTVILAVLDSAAADPDWSNVQIATDHLILGANLEKFSPQVNIESGVAGRQLNLRFVRDAASLPDLAYTVLAADLTSGKPVPIRLSWPTIGALVEVQAQFEPAEQSIEDDGPDSGILDSSTVRQ